MELYLKEGCLLPLKVGDRVSHKLSDMTGTVVRIGEYVAVIKRDKPEVSYWWGQAHECYTAICLFENLEVVLI